MYDARAEPLYCSCCRCSFKDYSIVYTVKEEGEGDGRGWVGVINQTTFILLILLNVLVSLTEIRIHYSRKGHSKNTKNNKLVVIKDYESAFNAVTLIQIP